MGGDIDDHHGNAVTFCRTRIGATTLLQLQGR
jgi:hypothetical protein